MERKIYDLTRQDPLRSNNEWQNVNKGCGSEETPVMGMERRAECITFTVKILNAFLHDKSGRRDKTRGP